MSDSVSKSTFRHPSADGETFLYAAIWQPADAAPRAVVQLTHGMAEYIDRYDDFAGYLAGRGFAVVGQDMIGHGRSAADQDHLGLMPLEGGKDFLLADMQSLREQAAERFPGVPYIMYGHSMGSFMVRCYLARHGEDLAGAVLSGTGNLAPAMSKFGLALARHSAKSKGEDYKSSFIDGLGAGGYGKKIKNARTPLDWLSTDDAVVDAYIADPYCGFMFSVGAYAALLGLTAECAEPACAERYPIDLPLLYAAGEGDPVGDFGKGVRAAANLARAPRQKYATAAPVDVKIYPNMRHEIHNERGREQVYADMADWMEALL